MKHFVFLENPHYIQSSSNCSPCTYCRVATSCSQQTSESVACVHSETSEPIPQQDLVVTPSYSKSHLANRSTSMYISCNALSQVSMFQIVDIVTHVINGSRPIQTSLVSPHFIREKVLKSSQGENGRPHHQV